MYHNKADDQVHAKTMKLFYGVTYSFIWCKEIFERQEQAGYYHNDQQ